MLRALCGSNGEAPSCAECGDYDPLSGKWVPTRESPFGNWACENCPRGGEMHPYASRLIELFLLKRGGYPFGPDDLDIEDRMLLGAVEVALRRVETAEALREIVGESTSRIKP